MYKINASKKKKKHQHTTNFITHSSPPWWSPPVNQDPPVAHPPTTYTTRSRTRLQFAYALTDLMHDVDRMLLPISVDTDVSSRRCNCRYVAASANIETVLNVIVFNGQFAAIHLPKQSRGPQQRLLSFPRN